jgi:hypothetical protein
MRRFLSRIVISLTVVALATPATVASVTIEETAEVMGTSPATVKREWAIARAWLFRELGGLESAS